MPEFFYGSAVGIYRSWLCFNLIEKQITLMPAVHTVTVTWKFWKDSLSHPLP